MPILFENIYRGKTVLITGHTGFKGSWLSYWLTALGAHVVGYSNEDQTKPSHWSLLNLEVESELGDIADQQKLENVFKKHRPGIVFHLAAQSLVRRSYLDPIGTYRANVMGTLTVFESARNTQFSGGIINVTTDKCYDNKEQLVPYTESDPMGGFDPYSSSKGCSEIATQSYRSSFFPVDQYGKKHSTLLASVRSGNVIGGGDWADDRLIPDIIRATEKHGSVEIRNQNAVRPWQHVLEPLSGYLQLGQQLLLGKKEFAEAWNFGPTTSQTKTVQQVVDDSSKIWSSILQTKSKVSAHQPHEAQLLLLCSDKARNKLGWKNIWDYKKGLTKTIEWYKEYYSNNQILTKQQLTEYITDAKTKKASWIS